jgi:hypothetical protein
MSKGGSTEVEETSAQKELATYAAQSMADYEKRWLPVQQNLIAQAEEMGKADSSVRNRAEGRVAADTSARFGAAEGALEKTMSNNGTFGSSRSKLAITGLGDDAAKSKGLGITMADQQVDDAYTQALGSLAATGRGERVSVGDSLSQQASTSARQATTDAEAALTERAGRAQVVGQLAGYGLQSGMGKFGQGGGFTGTNDFSGVNGGNAMNTFLTRGSGGD